MISTKIPVKLMSIARDTINDISRDNGWTTEDREADGFKYLWFDPDGHIDNVEDKYLSMSIHNWESKEVSYFEFFNTVLDYKPKTILRFDSIGIVIESEYIDFDSGEMTFQEFDELVDAVSKARGK